jgi:ribosomal protein L11 methyltransferase
MKPVFQISLIADPRLRVAVENLLAEHAETVTVFDKAGKKGITCLGTTQRQPDESTLDLQLTILAAAFGCKKPQLVIEELPDLNWLKKVAADYPPIAIGAWTIYGGAHKDKIKRRRLALQIDASTAFGSGEHPTTRGCLLMMERLCQQKKPGRVLDMGMGSGILAMAAARRYHVPVIAADIDAECVRVAKDNAGINGLKPWLCFYKSTGFQHPQLEKVGPFDFILANILARPLCHMAPAMTRHLLPGGRIILAGLMNHQAAAVIAAYRQQRLSLLAKARHGEWTILAFQKKIRAK